MERVFDLTDQVSGGGTAQLWGENDFSATIFQDLALAGVDA